MRQPGGPRPTFLHSFFLSLTLSLIYSLTHLLTHSLTHLHTFTHSFTHSLTHSLTYLLIHSLKEMFFLSFSPAKRATATVALRNSRERASEVNKQSCFHAIKRTDSKEKNRTEECRGMHHDGRAERKRHECTHPTASGLNFPPRVNVCVSVACFCEPQIAPPFPSLQQLPERYSKNVSATCRPVCLQAGQGERESPTPPYPGRSPSGQSRQKENRPTGKSD